MAQKKTIKIFHSVFNTLKYNYNSYSLNISEYVTKYNRLVFPRQPRERHYSNSIVSSDDSQKNSSFYLFTLLIVTAEAVTNRNQSFNLLV